MTDHINDFFSFISTLGNSIYEYKYKRCDENSCKKITIRVSR
jgi:hypothetical protein